MRKPRVAYAAVVRLCALVGLVLITVPPLLREATAKPCALNQDKSCKDLGASCDYDGGRDNGVCLEKGGACFCKQRPGAMDLFNNSNSAGVANHPTNPTLFTLHAPASISELVSYHWNNGRGARPGTIGLRSQTGQAFGPFAARGVAGQGGAPNVNWVATPNATLPAGTYTVLDSDPGTWSHNPQSFSRGFVIVRGSLLAAKATPPSWPGQPAFPPTSGTPAPVGPPPVPKRPDVQKPPEGAEEARLCPKWDKVDELIAGFDCDSLAKAKKELDEHRHLFCRKDCEQYRCTEKDAFCGGGPFYNAGGIQCFIAKLSSCPDGQAIECSQRVFQCYCECGKRK